jgi:hypothetical protein
MKKQLNNTVIKNLTPEMGKKIIKKYQDDGWDTGGLLGGACEATKNRFIYYGVIDGIFGHYSLKQVQESNARIIELDHKPEFNPKRGDEVFVWDENESEPCKAIYLATIEGARDPIVSVHLIHEDRYRTGQPFAVTNWANMKPIPFDPKAQRKAELKKQIAELQEEFNRLVDEI